MRTSVCRIAMLSLFVLGVPLAAARAADAEDVDDTRFQYDELTMHPPAG